MTPFLRIIHREIGYEPGTREIVLFSPLEIYICMYIFQSGRLNLLNDLNLFLDVALTDGWKL